MIVGAAALAFCASPALGGDAVADARVGDIAAWLNRHSGWVRAVLVTVSCFVIWRLDAVRPGGLEAGGRDVKPIPGLMWLFASMTTLLALVLGARVFAGWELMNRAPIRDEALKGMASSVLACIVGCGLLWFVAKQAPSAGVKPGWLDTPIGVGLFLLVYPLVVLAGVVGLWVSRGVGAVDQDPLAHETLRLIAQNRGDAWMWVLVGVLVVLIPLVEELIYRVYLQSALLRVVRSRWTAVVLASLLFAAAHWTILPEGGKHALAPLFVLSIAIGAAYERTGRLLVPVSMHASFNALNLIVAFMIDPMVR